MTDPMLDEKALEALARAYDKEDAAQRGEPDPWESAADDQEWRAERLACAECASEGLYAHLLSLIADIRHKSGVGAKPMLSELADAIAARIAPRNVCRGGCEAGGVGRSARNRGFAKANLSWICIPR